MAVYDERSRLKLNFECLIVFSIIFLLTLKWIRYDYEQEF